MFTLQGSSNRRIPLADSPSLREVSKNLDTVTSRGERAETVALQSGGQLIDDHGEC